MPAEVSQVRDIVRRLGRVRASALAVGVSCSLTLGLVAVGLAWIVVTLVDMGLGLDVAVVKVMAIVGLGAAGALFAYHLVRVFSVSHSIMTYAARVGRELKEIGLDLVTALDLSEVDDARLGYSTELITKAIDEIAARARRFNLYAGIKKKTLVASAIPLAAVVLAGAIWWQTDSAGFKYSATRLGFFWGLSRDSGIRMSVEPGDCEMLAGEDLIILAEIGGFARQTPRLYVVLDREEVAFTMEKDHSVRARGHARFTSTLARIDRDFTYFITMADQSTRVFRVSVEEEPRITTGKITLVFPGYTGLGQEILPQGIWDITAPYGTRAIFDLRANCSPDSAWLEAVDAQGMPWRRALAVSGDSAGVALELLADFSYSVEVAARGGRRGRTEGPHRATVVRDKPPYVRIESPEREILLEADMTVPISVVGLDDYGISAMRLVYECKGEKGEIGLPYEGKTQARSEFRWEVGGLDVFPGDAIAYYATVADNDALTGPKYARTDLYFARVPSVYDLYREIEEEQDEDIKDLEGIAKEVEKLKEDLEDVAEEATHKAEITWEEEQVIRQNIAEQQDLAKKIEDVSASLDETLEAMSQNDLVSFEVIEKMEEIRRLLSEVANEDLMRALEKMREAMAKLTPEEIKAAMQNMSLTQEDLLRRLDQTIAMLKRLQIEQKMEAALNLANNMVEEQRDANEMVRQGDLADAATKEGKLREDVGTLEELLRELERLLRAEGNPLADEILKAGEFLTASGTKQAMSSMMSAMSEGRGSDAEAAGEEIEQDLSEVAGMLKMASESLTGEEKRRIIQALTKAMNGLMDVSGRQEQVLAEIDKPMLEVSPSELARREVVYKEALDGISEALFDLSKRTLFVSPILGRAVLRVGSMMEKASGLLAHGGKSKARIDVKASLGAMNELITGLMDATDKASSCSSPSGLCEAFDSLENMCSMQMGINQGTQQMLGVGEEGLSMEARAQMARLAAEQETVRKGLAELAGEYGDRSEILGRMSDLAEEAKRVVEDLKGRQVNRETLERQERILSRLLDAQRSLRQRDYSQRRKSRPGETYDVVSPPPVSIQDREQMVRDLLYRGRGYYPPEYEDLIRAYFKAISARARVAE